MADEIDVANSMADLHLEAAIQNAKRVTGNERLTGFCRNDCGHPASGAFCSKECRLDHDKRERMGR